MLDIQISNAQFVETITFMFAVSLVLAFMIILIFKYSKRKIMLYDEQINNIQLKLNDS